MNQLPTSRLRTHFVQSLSAIAIAHVRPQNPDFLPRRWKLPSWVKYYLRNSQRLRQAFHLGNRAGMYPDSVCHLRLNQWQERTNILRRLVLNELYVPVRRVHRHDGDTDVEKDLRAFVLIPEAQEKEAALNRQKLRVNLRK